MCTFRWDGGIVTLLFLRPHTRCSYHHHASAYNRFTVISGTLGVKTDKGYTSWIGPRQQFDVEPDVKHEFLTRDEETIIEEIAFVKYNEHDIVRERLGGTTHKDYPYVCPKCGSASIMYDDLEGDFARCLAYNCHYAGTKAEFIKSG